MPNTMKTFSLIWFGQLVSLLGTSMTRFALLIWAYQQTQNATTLALLGFFSFLPYVLLSPVAGVWVDRWDRRKVMIAADLCAGLMTVWMLSLYSSGALQIWHLYVGEALTGMFEAFQIPAYAAATTMLVPQKQVARANGMRALAMSAGQVIAPFLGGALLHVIDIDGVMLVDVVTFSIAVGILLVVKIPRPKPSTEGSTARGSMRHEVRFGFAYILARPGLVGLLLVYAGINLFAALTYFGVMPAMILARSGGDKLALATVQGALGLAGVVGGLAVSIFGLPKRRVHAIFLGGAISFLLGDFLFAVGRDVGVWTAAALIASFFVPFIIAAERSIWQMKVPPDVQGRVLAVREMCKVAPMPLGYLAAGPLADLVFEPAMSAEGSLAGAFGWLVGTGPGAGMALMFVCTSVLGMAMCLSGYLFPATRSVETDLPDAEIISESEEEIAETKLAAKPA